jgi:hypothetical protein
VIRRASWDARNATTSATSAGCPIRLRALSHGVRHLVREGDLKQAGRHVDDATPTVWDAGQKGAGPPLLFGQSVPSRTQIRAHLDIAFTGIFQPDSHTASPA